MIRRLIFLLILLSSLLVNAETKLKSQTIINKIEHLNELNRSLLIRGNDNKIDALLNQQNQLLNDLILQLKSTAVEELPINIDKKRINFLKNRIHINKEKNNLLAVQRDEFKWKFYQAQQQTYNFIAYLIEATRNYKSSEKIVKYAEQALIENDEQRKLIILPESQSSIIYKELKENYIEFQIVNDTYRGVLGHIVNNSETISTRHWLQKVTLNAMITYVNHFEIITPINYKLSPLKIDVGGTLLSIIIVSLVYLCHPFVFKFTSCIVETYILDPRADHQELIYHEIRKPLRVLLIFFGLDLATYAFFYKNDYRLLIENITFVIYSVIYAWFFFKLLDSVALLHIRKISQANKELRKELFNLGRQAIKWLIFIIVVALCLKHFGINIIAIVSTLGIGGLAFALAAKDTLSNLFGGITILFDNIFRMGDWVKIDNAEGTVAEIGLRSTTIRTFDNALITIPNALVSVSSVKNWSRRSVGRRIKMYIGITYESDMKDIRQALNDIREMLQNHEGVANSKSPMQSKKKRSFLFSSQEDTQGIKNTQLVFMDKYNDFSIDILIYCFSKTVNWKEWLTVKEDILFKVAAILQKNNLEFAYPTEVRINRSESVNLQTGLSTDEL